MSPTVIFPKTGFRSSKESAWLTQALGAVGWGAFFSVAPIAEVLFLGCFLWLPLLLWRETVRARRHGFWAGFAIRFAVVGAVVTLAAWAPVKYEDRTLVGPFPSPPMTLAELSKRMPGVSFSEANATKIILLPTTTMSLREFHDEIEEQTGDRPRLFRCGNMRTILFG